MTLATIQQIRQALAHDTMRYTPLPDARIVHQIPVGFAGANAMVAVVVADGSYEWVIRDEDGSWSRSDCGYTCAASALRDGLIEWDPPDAGPTDQYGVFPGQY